MFDFNQYKIRFINLGYNSYKYYIHGYTENDGMYNIE